MALGVRGLGECWPNPSVGCVIVLDGHVVGRGRTGIGGRPHAETQALAMAGAAARGAVAYVSLEPCNHHGRTPPCAEALIAAGIGRVVIGMRDPDPRAAGGVARLRACGIGVDELADAAAEELAAGFACRIVTGRPLVTLKLATTLDGRIAAAGGQSRWITGPLARRAAHALRASHDAVMVGIGTVLADDPQLDVRLGGRRERPLVRVVVDRRLRLPPGCALLADRSRGPVWVVTGMDADPKRGEALRSAGAEVISVRSDGLVLELDAVMRALGERGLTRVLVEGGAAVAASLLRDDLVDRVAWFHAPAVMGGDGLAAAGPLGVTEPGMMKRFVRVGQRALGPDVLTMLRVDHRGARSARPLALAEATR